MEKSRKGELEESKDVEMLRRCGRLKGKEDLNVEGMAREGAASKDEYGESIIPIVINTHRSKLLEIASGVGVDLGTQIDMIDYNTNLIKK